MHIAYVNKVELCVSMPPEAGRWATALAKASWIAEDGAPIPPELRLDDAIEPAVREILAITGRSPNCHVHYEDGQLLVSSHSANVRELACLLQATMRSHSLPGAIGFEWSCDSTNPLPDSYGGGAAIVTPDGVEIFRTDEWLDRRLAQIKAGEPVAGPAAEVAGPAAEVAGRAGEDASGPEIRGDAPEMQFFVGIHTHRHGISPYLFEVPADRTMTEADFIAWLGDDFEQDRDEFVDVIQLDPEEVDLDALVGPDEPADTEEADTEESRPAP